MRRKLWERAFDKAVLNLPLTTVESAALDWALYGRQLVPPPPFPKREKRAR